MLQISTISISDFALNENGFRIKITYEDVLNTLVHMPSGVAGPDGLKGEILRTIAPLIARPVFIIYQNSIFNGTFPSAWKRARIVPIYKGKGSYDCPDSYRPVSLCNILDKCLERLIYDQLTVYLEQNKLLSNIQHGFRKGRSTLTNLLVTDKYIAKWMNNSIPFDLVSFDMSKAFDRVPHDLILRLLSRIGFYRITVKWFHEFLVNRIQFVQHESASSCDLKVTSGTI